MQVYVAHDPAAHASGTTSWRASQLLPLVADAASRTSLSDGALLTAMRRGDEAAAGTLYDRHSSTVMALTFRMVRERADAESIVLETFMQAWRDAGRFDASRGSALSWLITIARTRALDFLRTAGRQAKLMPVRVEDMPAESFASEERTASASHAVEQREQQQAVAAALRTLPDNQRVAIELAFYEGLSHSEIAERLGEPLGTVKTRIRLGMTKLRDVLRVHAEEAVS
jgi:RNA polymerase sigma-70 factor (ECF subfamily)